MMQFIYENPWIVIVGLTMMISITAILIAVPFENWRKVRQAEVEASLKHTMLERGMSAEEIATVINAGTRAARRNYWGTSTFVRDMAKIHDKEPSRVL